MTIKISGFHFGFESTETLTFWETPFYRSHLTSVILIIINLFCLLNTWHHSCDSSKFTPDACSSQELFNTWIETDSWLLFFTHLPAFIVIVNEFPLITPSNQQTLVIVCSPNTNQHWTSCSLNCYLPQGSVIQQLHSTSWFSPIAISYFPVCLLTC